MKYIAAKFVRLMLRITKSEMRTVTCSTLKQRSIVDRVASEIKIGNRAPELAWVRPGNRIGTGVLPVYEARFIGTRTDMLLFMVRLHLALADAGEPTGAVQVIDMYGDDRKYASIHRLPADTKVIDDGWPNEGRYSEPMSDG